MHGFLRLCMCVRVCVCVCMDKYACVYAQAILCMCEFVHVQVLLFRVVSWDVRKYTQEKDQRSILHWPVLKKIRGRRRKKQLYPVQRRNKN